MTDHETKTVPVTVHLTEAEIQNAIERGVKAALKTDDSLPESRALPSTKGKATGAFIHQWRGQVK